MFFKGDMIFQKHEFDVAARIIGCYEDNYLVNVIGYNTDLTSNNITIFNNMKKIELYKQTKKVHIEYSFKFESINFMHVKWDDNINTLIVNIHLK